MKEYAFYVILGHYKEAQIHHTTSMGKVNNFDTIYIKS